MSNKNKMKRVSKIFVLLIVVLSLVLWLMPVGSIFAVNDGCPTTADVPLKGPHQSQSWDAMEGGKRLFEDDCDNPIQPGPGEVVWHLILSPVSGDTTAWIDLNGNNTRDSGDSPNGEDGVMKGSGEGGAIHWWILDGTTSQNWVAKVTNPVYLNEDCDLKTALKVSHVCYGGDVCEGDVTVVKTISGQTPTGRFSVDYYIGTPGGATRGPFTLNSGNNWTNKHTLPCDGGYSLWEDEDSLPEGFEFNEITSVGVRGAIISGNNISFGIGPESDGTITIDNTEKCEGDVTVVKTINGQTPTGRFSVDYYIGTPGGATRGPFTLNAANGWSNNHTLPCGRNYSLWEDEGSLPEGYAFNQITADEGVTNPRIDGNNILFGVGPDDSGTITIDNTEECTGEVTVEKYLNGATPTVRLSIDFFVEVNGTRRGPFTLNGANGWSMTFDTLPCGAEIEIYEDEASLPEGVVFDRIRSTIGNANINGNSIIFTAASGDNGTIGIMNKEECTGKVTVVKYIDDKVATEGSFTIKISYGDVTREFILDASNGWSKTLNLPCDIEYKIWEDEGSLPSGIVFSKIRSTIQGAVIAGNSIIFTVSSGDNGAIGIMNTEELYKIIVKKTTDGLVEANTDFNFNLVGPGTNVTKTIKAGAGSSGNTTFENLKAGSYILTETNTGFNTWVSFSPDPKTSGSPGKSVTINLPQDADKKNTVYVYFHNDPGGNGGNGKKDGDGDGIEVLGIQELPFTGFNWIYYVIGMALIIAGGFTSISVTKLLRRKEQ